MSDNHQTTKRTIMTSSFPDRESAERAFHSITERGYKSDETHVLMTDETRKRLFGKDSEKSEMGNKAMAGGGVGGAIGGAVGATLVGIMAAAGSLAIPGIGLVIAGPLAGALAGGAAGATAGGVVGMLVGAGIPEDRAKIYEKDLKSGSIVLGVTPRNDEDARHFESEWHGTKVSS